MFDAKVLCFATRFSPEATASKPTYIFEEFVTFLHAGAKTRRMAKGWVDHGTGAMEGDDNNGKAAVSNTGNTVNVQRSEIQRA